MRLARHDLKELALFEETSRSELAEIARQLTMLTVPAGKVLVSEGGIGNEFMIIARGEAEVSQGGRTIATLGHGDLVGEMALLGEPRSLQAQRHRHGPHRHGDVRRLAERVPADHRGRALGRGEGAPDGRVEGAAQRRLIRRPAASDGSAGIAST